MEAPFQGAAVTQRPCVHKKSVAIKSLKFRDQFKQDIAFSRHSFFNLRAPHGNVSKLNQQETFLKQRTPANLVLNSIN